MDTYGTCGLDDAPIIAQLLDEGNSVVFSYTNPSVCEVTAFVITIATNLTQLGTLPFGGQVNGSCLIACLYHGVNWFNLKDRRDELSPNYIEKKLNMRLPDAENVALMLNAISKEWGSLRSGDQHG